LATSGTVSTTTFNNLKIIETAFRYCKIPPQKITAEMLQVAREQLYLYMSFLVNEGTPLWTQEKIVLPMYFGAAQVPTPIGTIDLLSCNYRTLSFAIGTDTQNGVSVTTVFSDATRVTTVGINPSSTGTYTFQVEYWNGSSWQTLLSFNPLAYEAGHINWYDVDEPVSATEYRITELNGNAVAFENTYWGNTPNEIPMAPISLDSYTNLPNKTFQGRPLQYFYDKRISQPTLYLWPTPDATAASAQIVAWRTRHLMDVGAFTDDLEVPQRWYQAVCAQLALRIAMVEPSIDIQMVAYVQTIAKLFGDPTWSNEADSSPFMMAPDISMYTA
jgi:hypothetical protein